MKIRLVALKTGVFAGLSFALLSAVLPNTSHAIDPSPPSFPLCAGFGVAPFAANVIPGTPANEVIVTTIDETVLADTNADDLREVLATLRVKAVDLAGNVLWTSSKLNLQSQDVATVFDGGGFVPDFYTLPTLDSSALLSTIYFIVGGFSCHGVVYGVEHNGQKYLAVVAAFLAQMGDDATGTDHSRVSVWILDPATGAVVKRHILGPYTDYFLVGFSFQGFVDLEGDGNDELVGAWARHLGDGRFKVVYESFDLLSGASNDRFVVSPRQTLTIE